MRPTLIAVASLALLVCLAGWLLFPVDLDLILMSITASWFVFGKMTYDLYQLEGHGISGRKGVYGISLPLLGLFVAIGAAVAVVVYCGWTMPSAGAASAESILNIKLLCFALIAGYVAPFVLWVAWLHDATYYGSEYSARVEFSNRGLAPEAIEQKIAWLRARGAFGPDA